MLGKITLWRSAIIRRPASEVTQQDIETADLAWLPTPPRWSFRADPFGVWQQDCLHVFVERFDYRDRRGRIEVLTYDHQLTLQSVREALREPWHLSYPFVFESDGEQWMLPEASASGHLTLYRAADFPNGWQAEATIGAAANAALDATPLFWGGRWWLFYALRRQKPDRAYELHICYADSLCGPWQAHRRNPVRVGLADCRPAGTPIVTGSSIDLPVQDARQTYGGAVRRLRISQLDEERFEAESQPWLEPAAPFAPFDAGLHTLSAAGAVSLVDFKRIDGSLAARLYKSWSSRR